MWIQREISQIIESLSSKKACIVLTGARQTGKSSVLNHLYPEVARISLDLPRNADSAETDGENFLKKLGSPSIIDEVQYAPQLFRYLKASIDENPQQYGRYFLTGSEKFQLMESVSDSLSGRASILELHSLSIRELEVAFSMKAEGDKLWEWIFKGGYPEIYEKDLNTQRFYSDYLATYIERDVRKVLNIKNTRIFDQFLRLISTTVGQLLSYNRLASDLGVSATTIKNWVHVLEVTNIISVVSPWLVNARKKIIKTPKLYFLDTGLACFLNGIQSHSDLIDSPFKGPIFENHVYAQMVRSFTNRGQRAEIYFFRDHTGNEVDFLQRQGNSLYAYECKSNEDPKVNIKPFIALEETFPKMNVNKFYITPSRDSKREKAGVVFKDSIEF